MPHSERIIFVSNMDVSIFGQSRAVKPLFLHKKQFCNCRKRNESNKRHEANNDESHTKIYYIYFDILTVDSRQFE